MLARHEAAWAGQRRPGVARLLPGAQGRRAHTKDKDTVQALNDLTLVQEKDGDGQDRDMLIAHLLQAAIRPSRRSSLRGLRQWPTTAPLIELHDLLELVPAPSRPGRRGRARGGDRQALLHRGHVARGAVQGGARDPRPGHEPAGRHVQLRRGRRGPLPLQDPGPGPRRQELQDQADRLGPLRGHARVPGPCRRAADQDGPGLQAGRGRPAARPQGVGRDRPAAPHPARRGAHLAAPTTTSTPSRTWPSSSTTSSRSTRPRCR